MEALKRELERKKREKAALLSSLSDNNDNKNNNKGDGVNSAPTTSTKNKFMSKKQREEHLFRVAAAARERESEEEEEKKKKRTNGNAEEEETTRNKISSSSSVAAAVRAFAGGGGGGNAGTSTTTASKFRSAAARRAFENDEKSKNNDEKSGSKNEREEEELHKRIEREVKNLTNAEVIARLRKLGQPAKLFAEKEEDRRMRLEVAAKNIKVRETDEHVGGQQANELLKYNREKNNNNDDGNNNNGSNKDKSGTKNGGDKNNNATTTTTNNSRKLTTKEQEIEKKKREEETAQLEFERAAKRLKKQMDAETDPNAHPIDRVAEHFKRLLKEWAMDIEGTKFDSNAQKRQQVANCELTKTHMKPLFKKMKKRDLPNDIERALFLIFEAMKARDYKRATDAYVGVAIGNAAWPIGVTSVGIHDRSAREKISATTQAHAMQDEETRKYLQSVKRLITFSQRAYPTNPSLGFDWNGNDKKALEHAERATPGFLNASLPALPDGGEQQRPKHNANVTDDGGRKWESLMRHAYDNVKTGG